MGGMRAPIWSAVCALCVMCALAANSEQKRMTVVQGEIPQKDVTRATYRMRLPKTGTRAEDSVSGGSGDLQDGWTRVRMVSTLGQALQCVVPTPAPTPVAEPLGADTYDDVDELLRGYKNECYLRDEGWWMFEFCYGDSIVQFHKPASKDEEKVSYVLGRFDKDYDAARRKDASNVPRPDAPFTQLLGNGSMCDLTGRPREVLVKYICASDTSQMTSIAKRAGELVLIQAIREVASCVYELELISSAICKQKLYRMPARRTPLDINCVMEKGELPFLGLEARHMRKGKASLTL